MPFPHRSFRLGGRDQQSAVPGSTCSSTCDRSFWRRKDWRQRWRAYTKRLRKEGTDGCACLRISAWTLDAKVRTAVFSISVSSQQRAPSRACEETSALLWTGTKRNCMSRSKMMDRDSMSIW